MTRFIITEQDAIAALEDKSHPLDRQVQRRAVSLGDATGLAQFGIHYTVLEPGQVSTVLHRHRVAEEFLYIISGRGKLRLDQEELEVKQGDFIGLPVGGPAHLLSNAGAVVPLVYLVGGTRPSLDVCEYPDRHKVLYAYADGEAGRRDFVDA